MTFEIFDLHTYKGSAISMATESEKPEAPAPAKEDENNKKSFYQRNKAAIAAISAVAIAGITLAVRHRIKVKNLPEIELPDELSKAEIQKLEDLKNRLKTGNVIENLEDILSDPHDLSKFEAIDLLLKNGSKQVNEKTWEQIFDTLTSLKSTKKFKEEHFAAMTNKLLEHMQKNKLLTPEVIDKVLAKTENLSDIYKANILYNLADGYFYNSERDIPELSVPQIKKALNMLDDLSNGEFIYHKEAREFEPLCPCVKFVDLKCMYASKYLQKLPFDKNLTAEFTKIIDSDRLPDNLKLQLIHNIYYDTLLNQPSKNKDYVMLCKKILSSLEENSAAEYSKPYGFIAIRGYKFDLGCKVLQSIINDKINYITSNIISLEEKLRYTQMYKEMSKTVKIRKGIGGNSSIINELYNDELHLKCEIFFKNLTPNKSLEDIEKFVDEILDGYKIAKEHFIDGESILDDMDKELMKSYFDTFRIQVYRILQSYQLESMGTKQYYDTQDAIRKMENKIEQFAKKYFSQRANYSNRTNGSKFNSNDFIKDKASQAKAAILDFLANDKDFEEITQQLKTSKIDEDLIKNLKRKVAMKYHPDRIKTNTDEEKAIATANFQKIFGAIDILQKSLL